MLILWIAWLLIGIFLAGLFAGTVFPRILLEMKVALHPVGDRGVEKFELPSGIAVLYEPASWMRGVLGCYQLYRANRMRAVHFIGKWVYALSDAQYVLTCFHESGRPFASYRIVESCMGGKQYTRKIPLPVDTAYVSCVLERVDGKKMRPPVSLSVRFFAWMSLFLLSLALLADLLIFLAVRFSEIVGAVFVPVSTMGVLLAAMAGGIVLLPLFATMVVILCKAVRHTIKTNVKQSGTIRYIFTFLYAAWIKICLPFRFLYCKCCNLSSLLRQLFLKLIYGICLKRKGGRP